MEQHAEKCMSALALGQSPHLGTKSLITGFGPGGQGIQLLPTILGVQGAIS